MITETDARRVSQYMASDNDVQRAQTRFRMWLVEGWQIPRGARVLEIGCGQGDMTAVLADAVGAEGHVTAVDIAAPDYGAPITLGGATDHLKGTSLGPRIDFHFQYDVLDLSRTFPTDAFDAVVLAHCSWYFASLDHLRRVLLRVRPWASRLCFSEWDMEPHTLDQVAHLLSVLIQGQIEAHKVESTRNVRTPFSKTVLRKLLEETGWSAALEAVVDASLLKDADWEIEDCLQTCLDEAAARDFPLKFREFLGSQVDILRRVAARGDCRPLPSYSIVAKRSSGTHPDRFAG